jgi:hypothetical protein
VAGKKKTKKTKKESQEALSRALAKVVRTKSVAAAAVSQVTRMVVSVDIDSGHLIPYSVRWDGDRVLDSLVSDQAMVTVSPGDHVLSWHFNHGLESTWRHKLTVQPEGQGARVLDEKNSSANPNDAVSGGLKVFVA